MQRFHFYEDITMPDTWIIVANNACARIFSRGQRQTRLREVADLVHPAGRMTQLEQHDKDRPGRSFDSRGAGRHALEPQTGHKLKEATLFARQMADYLEQHEREFEELIIVCAPRLLGLLRKQMSKPLAARIRREIRKSIVYMDADSIRKTVYGKKRPRPA
jgi:protein required for attachment to host cells